MIIWLIILLVALMALNNIERGVRSDKPRPVPPVNKPSAQCATTVKPPKVDNAKLREEFYDRYGIYPEDMGDLPYTTPERK